MSKRTGLEVIGAAIKSASVASLRAATLTRCGRVMPVTGAQYFI